MSRRNEDHRRGTDRRRSRSPPNEAARGPSRYNGRREEFRVDNRYQGGYSGPQGASGGDRRRGDDFVRSHYTQSGGNQRQGGSGGHQGAPYDDRRRRDRFPGPQHTQSGGNQRQDSVGDPRGRPDVETVPNLPALPGSVQIPPNATAVIQTPIRPTATVGERLEVLTNHYLLQSLLTGPIYEYALVFKFSPSSQTRANQDKMSPIVIEKAFKAVAENGLFKNVAVFNRASLLWSPDRLFEGDSTSYRVKLLDHTEDRPNVVDISIRNMGPIDKDSQARPERRIMWLNALLGDFPSRQQGWFSQSKGLSFFIRQAGLFKPLKSTKGIIEATRGLHQAMSSRFGCLSVNVDTSVAAFYTPGRTLRQTLFALAGVDPESNIAHFYQSRPDMQYLSDQIAGMVFVVTHAGDKRQARPIKAKGLYFQDGIFPNSTQAKFMVSDPATGQERETTVAQYFRERYSVTISCQDLPLVESRFGLYPLEVCSTAPGQRYKAPLEGAVSQEFIKFAASPAFERRQSVEECVKRLQWHNQDILKAHGVSISTKMLKVEAVKLQPPRVHFHNNRTVDVKAGTWNLKGLGLIKPKQINSWGILFFTGSPRPVQVTEFPNFFQSLQAEMGKLGLSMARNPKPVSRSIQPQADLKPVIAQLNDVVCREFQCRRPDMFFVFVNASMSSKVYQTVKAICEVDLGIPSQVLIVEKSLRRVQGQTQYCANVCLKINAKLAGVNATVHLPERFDDGNTMVLGADVTHPSAQQLCQIPPPPSMAALVGTYDHDCVRYTATASPQPSTQESIAAGASMPVFQSMVQKMIGTYQHFNHERKPQVVVYFRDGVSDSQIDELLNGEVKAIRDLVAPGKLTAILAQKRHHTRFFPVGRSADRNGNIEPGTVIERGPNSAYICGHAALQGTVRPTHFVKIYDDNELSKDEFHAFVMHGVHSYAKATRAVHTPAAIYYADQVAERSVTRFRTGDNHASFHDVHDDLRNSMWWQ